MPEHNRITVDSVLTTPVTFPNEDGRTRLAGLVGLDHHIEALTRDLHLIFDPLIIEDWSRRHYGKRIAALDLLKDSVSLIVFEGDVGTGKTALAESIGQQVAEDGGYGVHQVKMSTQVRGTGYVGEMGTLLAESFKRVEAISAQKGEPVIFVIDEADSLLTTRASTQHHHEDKSGVNTILQHLDDFHKRGTQVSVIAITNRVAVLDPAVKRRATSVFTFTRPTANQRARLLGRVFGSALSSDDIDRLTEASEPRVTGANSRLSFSYSDLTLRFAVPAIRDAAWRDRKLNVENLLETIAAMSPTPSI